MGQKGDYVVVPRNLLDEAYRILASWSENERAVPAAWRDRMAQCSERLYRVGARSAVERASGV